MNRTGYLVGFCVLAWAASASAQPRFGDFLSSRVGDKRTTASYDYTAHLQESIGGQNATFQLNRHDTYVLVPLAQDDRSEWLMSARFEAFDIETRAVLPDTWQPFPTGLYDVGLSTSYRRKLDNGWIVGGGFMFGSASDRPFASGEEMVASASGVLRVPAAEDDAWLFLLNWANNREFLAGVPIPGVAYELNRIDRLQALLGVPVSRIRWEPIDRLSLEATYLIPRTFHTKVGYDLIESLQAYAAFDWANERFFRHDRRDDDDRLFFYEKRVVGGVRWEIVERVSLDISAGYAFDRFFFEGEDYGDRGDNRIDIADGPVARVQLRVSF